MGFFGPRQRQTGTVFSKGTVRSFRIVSAFNPVKPLLERPGPNPHDDDRLEGHVSMPPRPLGHVPAECLGKPIGLAVEVDGDRDGPSPTPTPRFGLGFGRLALQEGTDGFLKSNLRAGRRVLELSYSRVARVRRPNLWALHVRVVAMRCPVEGASRRNRRHQPVGFP